MNAVLGTRSLVRLVLRRDRISLSVWVLALVGITYATANAIRATYDTPEEVASYSRNLGDSTVTIAFNGPPVALDEIGGILVYETSVTLLIGIALMAVFTVARHTRVEEELGRTELLAAAVVGRHAPLAAAVTVSSAASVLIGLGTAVSMMSVEMPDRSAWSYGAAVTAVGLVFTGVAAVAVQLTANARTARGLALAALGVAFAARAVGDVRESFLTWFSPLAWSQQVRVADDDRWWPLGLSAVLVLLLLAMAAWLVTRRDVGSGILPARPGPATAAPALRSPFGLAWRLQRGSILGWSTGLAVLGLLFGSLTEEIEGMMEDNPTMAEYFAESGGSITDSYFATVLVLMCITAAGFAVASGLRLRSEESNGRLEQVLAGAVPRAGVLLQWMAVTLIGTVLVVTAAGLGLAAADALVRGDGSDVARLMGLTWAYLPAVLVLPALAALLSGVLPRAALLTWAWLAIVFVISWLGPALDLPGAVNALSPFDHLPAMPGEPVAVVPMLVLTLLAAGLTAAGVVGFRRRDAVVG